MCFLFCILRIHVIQNVLDVLEINCDLALDMFSGHFYGPSRFRDMNRTRAKLILLAAFSVDISSWGMAKNVLATSGARCDHVAVENISNIIALLH